MCLLKISRKAHEGQAQYEVIKWKIREGGTKTEK
jgi:hypothetical protein